MKIALCGVALFFFSSNSALAETLSCNQISSVPITLSQPGSYCLGHDLSFSSSTGVAITILSSGVKIDFNGHLLTGQAFGNATSTGIQALDRTGVEIRNGVITGFLIGINLSNSSPYSNYYNANVVENMNISYSGKIGIAIDSGIVSHNLLGEIGSGSGSTVNGIPSVGILVGPSSYAGNVLVKDNDILRVVRRGGSMPRIGVLVNNGVGVIVDTVYVSNADSGVLFNPRVTGGKYREVITTGVATPFSGGIAVGYNN